MPRLEILDSRAFLIYSYLVLSLYLLDRALIYYSSSTSTFTSLYIRLENLETVCGNRRIVSIFTASMCDLLLLELSGIPPILVD